MYGLLSFAGRAAVNQTWQTLKLGAGANLSGSHSVSDGAGGTAMVVRTDTGGAYRWNPNVANPVGNAGGTGAWVQLMTSASMPALYQAAGMKVYTGVYEVQMAPSNSSVLYAMFPVAEPPNTSTVNSTVYKSTDSGASWVATSFTSISLPNVNPNDGNFKQLGQKMAIHPTDPNTVVVGAGASGLFYTADGGNIWNTIASVPASSGSQAITGISFQPGTPNTVLACTGTAIYRTTTGPSGTWSRINSAVGPQTIIRSGTLTSNGTYLVVDGNGDIWTYISGTWAHKTTDGVAAALAVDPNNANHILAVHNSIGGSTVNGALNESTNGGVSWSGWSLSQLVTATDIPYLAVFGIDPSSLFFDQTVTGKIYVTGDRGFATTTLSGAIVSGTTTVAWVDQSVGVEELVVNDVIVPPGTGVPIAICWDSATFKLSDLTKYPTAFGPVYDQSVCAGWSIDYAASSTSFVVLAASGFYAGGPSRPSYSSDGGGTWTGYTSPITETCVAVSSTTNWIIGAQNAAPQFTINQGGAFTAITLPGVASFTGIGSSPFNKGGRWIVADRVNADQFTVWCAGKGFYKTTNKGVTFTQVNSTETATGGGSPQIKSVPGQANHIWWAQGAGGSQGFVGGGDNPLKVSQDAGATWSTTAITGCFSVGFGKAAAGQSYPAVYCVGNLTTTSLSTVTVGTGNKSFNIGAGLQPISTGTPFYADDFTSKLIYGLVVSYDPVTGICVINCLFSSGTGSASSWEVAIAGTWQNTTGLPATAASWKQIGIYPNNNPDTVVNINGDMTTYGRVFVAFAGSGAATILTP